MSAQVIMPRLSQDMETGRIVEWLKAEGDPVEQGEPLLVVETDKATSDVEAPASGLLRRVVVQVGEDAAVGSVLATIAQPGEALPEVESVDASAPSDPGSPGSTGAAPARAAATTAPGISTLPTSGRGGRQPSSPAARRVAAELGVDLAMVHGSGEGGLVSEADVRAYAQAGSEPSSLLDDVTVVPLVGIRRRIAERMSLSRQTVADVTTFIDVDMTAVAALRTRTRLSYTAYVAWATAHTLPDFPMLNASFADDRILLRRDINLGIAVALDDGLVVPVVRNADRLDATEIASTIEDLSTRVRGGELSPEHLSGSTFTLTNSGTFGSLFFTPIVNLPEVAILGMGRVADAPVVRGGAVAVGKVMYLCLSYDHRAVDGASAVSFLAEVKRRLEGMAAEDA